MKRIVLLGGGHAHVEVLSELARRPLGDCEVRLVTPYRRQIYSGMLPGWIAGHYRLEECAIPLDSLARCAGVSFHETAASSLDLRANRVICANGESLQFDWLSIDTGPTPALGQLPGAAEYALPIRPIEGFVAAWPALLERIARESGRFDLAILGAGAGGLELAFAIRHRAVREGWPHLHVELVGSDALPLGGAPMAARRRALDMLRQRCIGWHGPRHAAGVAKSELHFRDGATLPFDSCWVVTGAAAPAWPAASGLAADEEGFIRVTATLQSESHPHVFAAGDVAVHPRPLTKSGVYAVRSGQALVNNLRRVCAGDAATSWTPQSKALYLISTGDRNALAIWGRWTGDGRWLWRLKDAIDKRYIRSKSRGVPAAGG